MKLLTAILSFIVAFLFISEVKAFSLSPVGFNSTIEPGKTQAFNILVINNEKTTNNFRVEINSVRTTDTGNRFYEKNADSAEFWGKVDQENFKLSPGQEKNLTITFNVPAGAAPGAHQLAILVAAENLVGGEIGLTAHSVISINLVVSGEVTEHLSIKKISLEKNPTGKNIWPVNIELYNEGTMDLQTAGMIQVKNMFGKEVTTENILLGNAIFPGSYRRIKHNLAVSAVWPGKYNVKLVVQFGKTRSVVASELAVWYLPNWFKGAVFALFITIIIWLWSRKKRQT